MGAVMLPWHSSPPQGAIDRPTAASRTPPPPPLRSSDAWAHLFAVMHSSTAWHTFDSGHLGLSKMAHRPEKVVDSQAPGSPLKLSAMLLPRCCPADAPYPQPQGAVQVYVRAAERARLQQLQVGEAGVVRAVHPAGREVLALLSASLSKPRCANLQQSDQARRRPRSRCLQEATSPSAAARPWARPRGCPVPPQRASHGSSAGGPLGGSAQLRCRHPLWCPAGGVPRGRAARPALHQGAVWRVGAGRPAGAWCPRLPALLCRLTAPLPRRRQRGWRGTRTRWPRCTSWASGSS